MSGFCRTSCPKTITLNFVRERAILNKTLFRGNELIRRGAAVGIYTFIAGMAVTVAAATQLVLLIYSYL